MKTFEDCIDQINSEIKKHQGKWNLKFLAHFGYEDIAQIIRTHIYNKWSLWDQSRPLGSWCGAIIKNQIKNITRNSFANFARPCIKCPFNQSQNQENGYCAITTDGTQCSECPLYARWEKSKKDAYGVKMPISIESASLGMPIEEAFFSPETFDFEKSIENLNSEIEKKLNNPKLFKAYKMLFIDKSTDEQVAKFMGYKSSEANRLAGYKQIRNLKIRFHDLAKKILASQDIIV